MLLTPGNTVADTERGFDRPIGITYAPPSKMHRDVAQL